MRRRSPPESTPRARFKRSGFSPRPAAIARASLSDAYPPLSEKSSSALANLATFASLDARVLALLYIVLLSIVQRAQTVIERQAREQRQLSVQQVAVQLNLKPSQVEQLEQDQLDGSMLETFARGYVRAYGRLLNLPEAEQMAAFSRQTGCVASRAKPMRTF